MLHDDPVQNYELLEDAFFPSADVKLLSGILLAILSRSSLGLSAPQSQPYLGASSSSSSLAKVHDVRAMGMLNSLCFSPSHSRASSLSAMLRAASRLEFN